MIDFPVASLVPRSTFASSYHVLSGISTIPKVIKVSFIRTIPATFLNFFKSEEKEKSDAIQEDSKLMEKAANKRSLLIKKVILLLGQLYQNYNFC